MEGSSFIVLEIVSKLWQQSLCHISRGRKVKRQKRLILRKKIPLKVKYDVFLKQEWSIKEVYGRKGSTTVIILIPNNKVSEISGVFSSK